jgi:hypothetical protein
MYKRRDRLFEAVLQTKAARLRARRLRMTRLATELYQSLTPLQHQYVVSVLRNLSALHPGAIDCAGSEGLSISQRNCILTLVAAGNTPDSLIDFLQDGESGNGIFHEASTGVKL